MEGLPVELVSCFPFFGTFPLLHLGNLSFARPVLLHYCKTLGKLTDKAGGDITASQPGKRLVVNNFFIGDP